MIAYLDHLVVYLQDYKQSLDIYKKMFAYFNWPIRHQDEGMMGVTMPHNSLWVLPAEKQAPNDRDSNGVNHIGLGVEKKEDVDTFIEEFLKPNNIPCLFGTPQRREEFMDSEHDYYQVMFELPGSVLFELVFTGSPS